MNSNYWLQRLLNGMNTPSQSPFDVRINPDVTTQQLDSFLANSMAQLNVQQRESVLEDLHGIRNNDNPESNPASVDIWLRMLDLYLQNIKRGTVYEVAEAVDRAYVTSRRFRMMFLRSERYDPEAAARQVIKYLELKRSLFGQEKLTKKITLADLNDDDKKFLASGAVQVSRQRDRSDRPILLFFPSLHGEASPEVLTRARYYTMMNMMESEENQKNGITLVYFGALPVEAKRHSSNPGLLWNLPIFFAAVHCCLNELSAYIFCSVAILRMPLIIRPRIRIHYGSCADCLYKLSSFGISREAILTDTNEPRLDHHSTWYRQRQNIELQYVTDSDADDTLLAASTGVAIVPQPEDVLFGPGSRKHEGNLLLRNHVLEMLDEHNGSSKGRKMQLTESVIHAIKRSGGRFLKQNEETKEWEEANHTEVCRKVAHAFRNIRRPSRAKKKA